MKLLAAFALAIAILAPTKASAINVLCSSAGQMQSFESHFKPCEKACDAPYASTYDYVLNIRVRRACYNSCGKLAISKGADCRLTW